MFYTPNAIGRSSCPEMFYKKGSEKLYSYYRKALVLEFLFNKRVFLWILQDIWEQLFIKHLWWLLLVWTLTSFFYNSCVTVSNYLNPQGKIWNTLQGETSQRFRFIRTMTALYEKQFSSENTSFVNRGKYFLWPWIGSAKSHERQLFSVIGS